MLLIECGFTVDDVPPEVAFIMFEVWGYGFIDLL
jgi:hypothetical protein